MRKPNRTEAVLIPGFFVRSAQLSDVDGINEVAIASAKDMTPGATYAEHAEKNQQRIASTGRANVGQLIERSTHSPELQRAIVASLGNVATSAEDSVIGYMFAKHAGPEDYLNAEHVLIHGAAVDRSHRHLGVGRNLLSIVYDWSQDMTLPICAQVADTNTSMLQMLEGSGFIQDGTYRPGGGNPVTYQVMVQPSGIVTLA